MTDDLKIALFNKRCKAVIRCEGEDAEAKRIVVCSNCGADVKMQDECPVCGCEVDWGF